LSLDKKAKPLFAFAGNRKLLVSILAAFSFGFLVMIFAFIYLGQIVSNPNLGQIESDAFLVVIALSLIDFILLLFARDFEFYDNLLKITDISQIRIIPYWEIEYFIESTSEIGKGMSKPLTIELKLRSDWETLLIIRNPSNSEIGMSLHEFLRKKTSPRILFHYTL
jgi:hypothetical protein